MEKLKMNECSTLTILRHCVDSEDRYSYLQKKILNETKPIRIYSAPTGAGKSYALLDSAIEHNKRILFMVPTIRLAQNLANTLQDMILKRYPDCDVDKKLAILTSNERKRIKKENPNTNVRTKRIRQIYGLDQADDGDMIIATPETVADLLLNPVFQKGTPQIGISDFARFDHIVFDEFHTIEARGFGFAAAFAKLVSCLNTDCKVSFLSATPIEIIPVLMQIGIELDLIDVDKEKIITGTVEETGDARAIHGNVTIKISNEKSMLALLESERETIRKCLDKGKQIVFIFDSIKDLMKTKNEIIDFFKTMGVDPDQCLAINSIDDSIVDTDGNRRDCDPLNYKVLICTSSIEMGVTFNAGIIVMDPGFNNLSFVQRIGRAARGDEDGHVFVRNSDSLNNKPDLRVAIAELKECDVISIDKFIEIFTKHAVRKFKNRNEENYENFGRMSKKAVFCSALFWFLMKNTWIGKKQGRREILENLQPNQVKIIEVLVDKIKKCKSETSDTWLKAYMKEACKLRTIGTSVIVEDVNGNKGKVPYHLYLTNKMLLDCDSMADENSLKVFLDRSFDEMNESFDTINANNQMRALKPHETGSIPVRTCNEWIQKMNEAMESNEIYSSEKLNVIKHAIELVKLTGILPTEKEWESDS